MWIYLQGGYDNLAGKWSSHDFYQLKKKKKKFYSVSFVDLSLFQDEVIQLKGLGAKIV